MVPRTSPDTVRGRMTVHPRTHLAADGPRPTGHVGQVAGSSHRHRSSPFWGTGGSYFVSALQPRPSAFLLTSFFVSFSYRIPFKIGQPKKQIVPKTVSKPILTF